MFKNHKNLLLAISIAVIFANSVFQIYESRQKIIEKIKYIFVEKRVTPINPEVVKNNKLTPPKDLKNLKITNMNADVEGMWSAPVDWNVNSIHMLMMPNGKLCLMGLMGK